MTELKAETITLLDELSEENLEKVLDFLKNLIKTEKKSAFGILSKYANPELIEREKFAWESEVAKKYGKSFD